MKGQKEAVVEAVKAMLPHFKPYKDVALVMLSHQQLESIKQQIGHGIHIGVIEYSKANSGEAFAYARSMVMNHLKKARELNGNQVYGAPQGVIQSKEKVPSELNLDILPDDLKAYVKTLV